MDRSASRQATQPGLVSSQLDANSLGDVANSVNLFRGDVNFPFKLVELLGRNGLNVVVSAFYGSNVHAEVETWNQDAPTGVLGVGWSIPFQRIVVDGLQAGNNRSASFYLVAEGVSTRLYPLGETQGVARFQLRTSPFWKIEYFRTEQYWVVSGEDGNRYIYGRFPDTASDGLQFGVRWGNWIGSSTQSQAQSFPVAWNLVRTENPYGDRLQFRYEQTTVPLGKSAAIYTQSCRLKQIIDSYDQQIIFTYEEKKPYEIQLPHIPPRPGDANAYQMFYETRYLDSIEVTNDQGQHLFTTHLTYDFLAAAQSAAGGSDPYMKRYLCGVLRTMAGGACLPAVQFRYASGAGEANSGALQTITYPEGGTVAYTYEVQYLDQLGTRARIDTPGVGYVPRVWYGADYVVVTWYHAQQRQLVLNVYKWDGLWESWSARTFGDFKLEDLQVLPSDAFFAVVYKESLSGLYRLQLYRENAYRSGLWDEHTVTLGPDFTSLRMAVGRDFVVVHGPTHKQLLFEQWDGFTRTWKRSTLPTEGGQQVALGAIDNLCLAAFSTSETLKFQIYYTDASRTWRPGGSQTLRTPVDWTLTSPQTFWQMGASFAAATFATGVQDEHLAYQLVLLSWREDYSIQALTVYRKSQALDIQNPALSCVLTGQALVGNAQDLYRFNGVNWNELTALQPRAGSEYRYTYGSDIVFATRRHDGRDSCTSFVYDPYQLQWRQGPISQAEHTAAPDAPIVPPTLSGDYATVNTQVYFRDARNQWHAIYRLPDGVDLRTLQNNAPEYIAYELSGNQLTRVTFLKDGQVIGPAVSLSGERIFTGTHSPGQVLTGPSCFLTFSTPEFDNARALFLYRVVDHGLAANQAARVLTNLVIDSGYHTVATEYRYDVQTARYDPGGDVVQFVRAWSSQGDARGSQGYSEYIYFNGLHPDVPGVHYPETDAFTNVKDFFSCVNGQLYQRHDRDASGRKVETITNFFFVSDAVGLQSVQGAFVRLRKQVNESHLPLFALDEPLQLHPELDLAALRAAFARQHISLASSLALSTEVEGRIYELGDAASDKRYTLMLGDDGQIQVFVNVARVTESAFNEKGQPWRSTTYNMNAHGEVEARLQETRYAWEIYPGMAARRLFSAIAETTTRSLPADVITSRTVTTYQQSWNGGNLQMWSAHKTYSWDGTPGTEQFDFQAWSTDSEPARGWLRELQILALTEHGLARETVDIDGLHHSTLFDRLGRFTVAEFANTSLLGDEGSYYGFEAYESPQAWKLVGEGGFIAAGDAYSGAHCLHLPGRLSDPPGLRAGFYPAGTSECYLLSCRVKTPSAVASNPDRYGWQITIADTFTRFLPLPVTHGRWHFFHAVIDPAVWGAPGITSLLLLVCNALPDVEILIDDICLTPFLGSLKATVVDDLYRHKTAELTGLGKAAFFAYNRLQEPALEVRNADQPVLLTTGYLWRQHSATFDPHRPGSVLTIQPRTGGSWTHFARGEEWQDIWQASAGWSRQDGELVYSGEGEGWLLLRNAETLANFALMFTLDLYARVDRPVGIAIGSAVTLLWENGAWHLRVADLASSVPAEASMTARDWLLLVTDQSVQLYADGQLVLGQIFPAGVSGAPRFFTHNQLGLTYLVLARDPLPRLTYLDNVGNTIQQQIVDDAAVITAGTLYDSIGRAAVVSKPARAQGCLPGYRPQLIETFDWQTGVMDGEVARFYPQDEGYPYTRNSFLPTPQSQVRETGIPGRLFAITDQEQARRHTTVTHYAANAYSELLPDLPVGEYFVVEIINPDGVPEVSWLDKLGQKVALLVGHPGDDEQQSTLTRHFYDESGNLVEVQLPDYFSRRVVAPQRFKQVQRYDFFGRVSARAFPDVRTPYRYVYDHTGRLRFLLDANGEEQGYLLYWTYDRLGRLQETGSCETGWDESLLNTHASTPDWLPAPGNWQKRLTYDGAGSDVSQIGQVVYAEVAPATEGGAGRVVEQLRYTSEGFLEERLTHLQTPEGEYRHAARFAYDNLGNIRQIVYDAHNPVNPLTVTYRYNHLGQISGVQSSEGDLAYYTYTAEGLIQHEVLTPAGAPAIETTLCYNPPGWLTEIASPCFTEQLEYVSGGYASAGYFSGKIARASYQVAAPVSARGFTRQYAYHYRYSDPGRLVTARNDVNDAWSVGVGEPTTFDPNGNIERQRRGQATASYVYLPGTNAVVNTWGSEEQAYRYNANGDVIAARPREIGEVVYNRVNAMATAVHSAFAQYQFLYDAGDQRVCKHSAQQSSLYFLGQDDQPLLKVTRDSAGALTTTCLVRGPRGLFALQRGTERFYLLRDHLGSTRVVMQGDAVVAAYNYLPSGGFMGEVFEPRTPVCDYLYTGQEFDRELGLYNYRTRLCDVELGRFYSTDPMHQFPSPYLYAGGDPINLVDPDGEFAWGAFFLAIGISALLGGAIGGFDNLARNWEGTSSNERTAHFFTGFGIGVAAGIAGGVLGYGAGAAAGAALSATTRLAISSVTRGVLIGGVTGIVDGGVSGAISGAGLGSVNRVPDSGAEVGQAIGIGLLVGGVSGGLLGGLSMARLARMRVRFAKLDMGLSLDSTIAQDVATYFSKRGIPFYGRGNVHKANTTIQRPGQDILGMVGHGDGSHIARHNADSLAAALTKGGKQPFKPGGITLLNCKGGRVLARELARRLHVPVYASNTNVTIEPGASSLYLQGSGERFEMYFPRGQREWYQIFGYNP
jgi:RHS repeat-associated protein